MRGHTSEREGGRKRNNSVYGVGNGWRVALQYFNYGRGGYSEGDTATSYPFSEADRPLLSYILIDSIEWKTRSYLLLVLPYPIALSLSPVSSFSVQQLLLYLFPSWNIIQNKLTSTPVLTLQKSSPPLKQYNNKSPSEWLDIPFSCNLIEHPKPKTPLSTLNHI